MPTLISSKPNRKASARRLSRSAARKPDDKLAPPKSRKKGASAPTLKAVKPTPPSVDTAVPPDNASDLHLLLNDLRDVVASFAPLATPGSVAAEGLRVLNEARDTIARMAGPRSQAPKGAEKASADTACLRVGLAALLSRHADAVGTESGHALWHALEAINREALAGRAVPAPTLAAPDAQPHRHSSTTPSTSELAVRLSDPLLTAFETSSRVEQHLHALGAYLLFLVEKPEMQKSAQRDLECELAEMRRTFWYLTGDLREVSRVLTGTDPNESPHVHSLALADLKSE
ncbi:MAG: hypothetical protein EOO70_07685 [Myxococcaceae bacterium]|nr:MAG: hypothetical protein EOO70_07685 [Myxococcaceae bacterium]